MDANDRLLRYPDAEELSADVAARLIDSIIALQATQDVVHLCLSTGTLTPDLQSAFENQPRLGEIDPTRLHLWWASESFADATDPLRSSTQALSQLHAALPLSAANAHTMPQRSGYADPDAAAYAYAQEIGDTTFDLCLLGLGDLGCLAGIFPNHPSLRAALDPQAVVIGVLDAPAGAPEQLSLAMGPLNAATQVWVFAVGESKRTALAASLAGDPELPAGHLHPPAGTMWFVDEAAAGAVPTFACSL